MSLMDEIISITSFLRPDAETIHNYPSFSFVFSGLILIICLWGLTWNRRIIWFLGFHIERNPLTTYILNLAFSDFGVLLSLFLQLTLFAMQSAEIFSWDLVVMDMIFSELFLLMSNTGQCLLAAVSCGRCASVLFSIWHRFDRPQHLSTIICALIWVLSFLICVIGFIFYVKKCLIFYHLIYLQSFINLLSCLPLITISTSLLFAKVYLKSPKNQQGKLLRILLLSLFLFLPLSLLFNVFGITIYFYGHQPYLTELGLLCVSVNSSARPLIYFLVGRQKGEDRENMKVILQRVFKEEESHREDLELSVQA